MTDVITQHLDVWTSALISRSTTGRGGNGKQTAYGIKKLRELILELAVRGKLVPQDPNDEPARVLLEKIDTEKAKLIKDGKIKNQKSATEISEEEKPYELPFGWEWARFPDVCDYKPGKTPSTKNPVYWSDNSDDIPWVSISDMEHFGRVTETGKKITQKAVDQVFKYEAIPVGSLLMSFKLTVGKIAILDVAAFHNEAIISIQPFTGISRDYLFNFLPTRALEGNTKRVIMGNTLNATSLSLLLMPVPPLAEQHRIVAKVDELMALCDQLEQQQTGSNAAHQALVENLLGALTNPVRAELVEAPHPSTSSGRTVSFEEAWRRIAEHFDTLFTTEHSIDQLKQTILQLAVMGKLIAQDANDEPASVLLEKISEEKTRLVKEGKTIKQNQLPDITKEQIPFELPATWEWTRLGIISEINPRNQADDQVLAGFAPMPLITTLYTGEHGYEERQWSEIKTGYTHFADGDIGLAKITPCFENSKAAVFVGLPNAIGAGTTELHIARPYGNTLNQRYVLFYLKSPGFLAVGATKMTGSAGQKRIPKDYFAENPFPLPPLAEQHRIVTKVDELMALCDALKARLNEAQTTQIHLADAIIEQAVA